MKLEQIQADIALCKEKIIKALDVDCYSVLPIYIELITTLKKELDNIRSTYSIGKGVQQSTIGKEPNFITLTALEAGIIKEGQYIIDVSHEVFINRPIWDKLLSEYPQSSVTAYSNYSSILIILR